MPWCCWGIRLPRYGGSEYLKTIHGVVRGMPPRLDLAAERALQQLLVAIVSDGLLESAHDCAEGGLAVTLAECCFDGGGIGLEADVPVVGLDEGGRDDMALAATLFGETASRVVVSVSDAHLSELLARSADAGVPASVIGRTGGSRFRLSVTDAATIDGSVAELEQVWVNGLTRYFEEQAA